jgi:hypothetical protein
VPSPFRISTRRRFLGLSVLAVLAASAPRSSPGQSWTGYANGPQHTGQATVASVIPGKIRWSTPVDLAPQYAGNGDLYIHYGSPMVTRFSVVLVPVKTGAAGGFRVEARRGTDGLLLWSLDSDWVAPAHNWVPPFGPVLAPGDRMLIMPAAGGTLITRTLIGVPAMDVTQRVAFFGLGNYNQNPGAFNAAIQVCTPVTWDRAGNLYFGYVSSGAALPGYPAGIASGLARIAAAGAGTFATGATFLNDPSLKVAYNCAPAVSNDGSSVYVTLNRGNGTGVLCKLDSATLALQSSVTLYDPATGNGAWVSDDSTATPTVGPDGDVYYGVLESNFPVHHARGWLLHFDGGLTTAKAPGSFGWDDSASVVPSGLVPSYGGSSAYLVLTKYNDYSDPGIGGTGLNKLAVLDPNATQADPINNTTPVMKEVLTVVGATPNQGQPGVREWCVNTVAIDPVNKCAAVNSEDGKVYRWDFTTNALSPALVLQPPTGEAYTPTLIGPDGAVYAVNNATLFCCDAAAGGGNAGGPVKGPGRN